MHCHEPAFSDSDHGEPLFGLPLWTRFRISVSSAKHIGLGSDLCPGQEGRLGISGGSAHHTISRNGMQLVGDCVYWVEPIAQGRLLRCPKTGCADSATAIVENLNNATGFAIDGQSIYVLEQPTITWLPPSEARLSRPGHEVHARSHRISCVPLQTR
jgi:hypothetical protein